MVAPAPEEEAGPEDITRLQTGDSNSDKSYEASPEAHLSLLETSRWLSESLMPQRHSQGGASAVIRLGIISEMRNVRCMTQIF